MILLDVKNTKKNFCHNSESRWKKNNVKSSSNSYTICVDLSVRVRILIEKYKIFGHSLTILDLWFVPGDLPDYWDSVELIRALTSRNEWGEPTNATTTISQDFLFCCKLKANKEINLTFKMTCDVHSLRLHPVFGCFKIRRKNKYALI